MPSPFPGMDPYLEDPAVWPGVHHLLIAQIGAALNRSLPAQYVANVNERVYVVQPDRDIYPDLSVARVQAPQPAGPARTAVLAESDPAWEVTVGDEEVREGFIEILAVGGGQERVICAAEVLSPANKAAGTEGRRLYRQKQREVLASPVHLLEFDLLRAGEHTAAAPREQLVRRGAWDYLVSLSRGGRREHFQVWASTVRQRLPRVRVPLAEGDPDVVLDLQDAFDRAYDDGAFSRRLRYDRPPAVPLGRADAEWARSLLPARGG